MHKLTFILILSLILNISNAQTKNCSPLAGTYTINQNQNTADRNFNSFTSAVEALKCGGISDSVCFEVATGEYKEAFIIPKIDGSSEQNTITFTSETRNADDVILSSDTIIHEAFQFMFYFCNCSNLKFKSITFKVNHNENSFAFFYFENVSNFIFEKNKFENLNFRQDLGFFLLFFQSSENIRVLNNDFQIKQTALALENTSNIELQNNNFNIKEGEDVIKLNSCTNGLIKKNTFTATNCLEEITALALLSSNENIEVCENYFNFKTSNVQCIQNFLGKNINICNNFFNFETSGYAIDIHADENIKIQHNTFSLKGSAKCINISTSASDIFIRNNIFSSKTIYSYRVLNGIENIKINNNCYNSDTTLFAIKRTNTQNAQLSFYGWRDLTGFDVNSIISDVAFISDADLHLQQGQEFLKVNNSIAEVTTDIDGDTRSSTMPYYGADESLDFFYSDICLENTTVFSINSTKNIQSVVWNFGDSQTSTEQDPTHKYNAEGNYTVSLTITKLDDSIEVITKDITITQRPEKPIIKF